MSPGEAVVLTGGIMLILFITIVGIAMIAEMMPEGFTALIKKLLNFLTKPFRHKTQLEKEIAKTEKEINLLKKQKNDIERLQKLKDEERELFEEVQDYEECE